MAEKKIVLVDRDGDPLDLQNIQTSLDGDTLHIRVDLSKQIGESGSGKSVMITSTHGNQKVPGYKGLFLSVNAYQKKK